MAIHTSRLDATVKLLKEDVDQVRQEFRDFRDVLRTDIRELRGAQLTGIRELRFEIRLMWAGFFGLGTLMAKGFHWI
ncbi:hypothetical protein [Paraburkholderia sp. BL10I2N1]|uniref:hypothetical protein n=1 Tax=Paraburkholderia sp. BL10I2N1 TaxID=1938796 RepID=UPI0010622571|nr:hypothetical protein [Paraburkholderia sp. BL10I2N1]TDN68304.1 hypothetical protein B0G77_1625 [Paraburkholderia sp. BL10I2N1]